MSNYPLSDCGQKPVITIDFKKKRVRIYKSTLYVLGNPVYIQFLINPSTHIFAVRSSQESEPSAQRIYWKTLVDRKQCCEFYSTRFVERLHHAFFQSSELCTYRIMGDLNEKKKSVLFNLKESVPINDEIEEFLTTEANNVRGKTYE